MAIKVSGNVAAKPGMNDPTSYDARSGAAKKPLTKFDTKWGMRSRSQEVGVAAGIAPGSFADAPDADPANLARTDVMSPEPKKKNLIKQTQILKTRWDMKGAAPNMSPSQTNGNTLDGNIGGKVLGEAILSGSTRLPGSASTKTDSGAAPKSYPASDPN